MSNPAPDPLGFCRNYWAESSRSMEEGNRARDLPLFTGGHRCDRLDNIVYRAMYDLRVPGAHHDATFDRVRPAVGLQKSSMIEYASQRLGVNVSKADKKDVLSAMIYAAAPRVVPRTRQAGRGYDLDGPGGGQAAHLDLLTGDLIDVRKASCAGAQPNTAAMARPPAEHPHDVAASRDMAHGMPRGWAATGRAPRGALNAAASIEPADLRRLVDALESISISIRTLADTTVNLFTGDSDDGEGEG